MNVGKKTLITILIGVIALAFIGGGTFAYFSDTESLAGNAFTAGTLDLTVEAENPWASAAIDVGPLAPGEAITPVAIDLVNAGNLGGDLYMRLSSVTTSTGVTAFPNAESGPVSSEPEYLAEGAVSSGGLWNIAGFSAKDDIDTVITLDCDYDVVDISNINGVDIATAVSNGWQEIDDDFTAADTGTVNFGATLDSTAGNEYQGDKISFTIEFYLAQDGQSPA